MFKRLNSDLSFLHFLFLRHVFFFSKKSYIHRLLYSVLYEGEEGGGGREEVVCAVEEKWLIKGKLNRREEGKQKRKRLI